MDYKRISRFENFLKKDNHIKSFIDWIINRRSEFVHQLSIESISAFNSDSLKTIENVVTSNGDIITTNIEENVIIELPAWYPTTSIDKLTRYVLLGFFRKFDIKKALTTIWFL